MTSMKELTEIGEKFGFEGEKLRKFVIEEQSREREARLREREMEREAEGERAEKLLEKEREIEIERFERERVSKREDFEMEAEQHRRAMELAEVQSKSGTRGNSNTKIQGPKLPFFDEEQDSMDSYVYRFERYATAQGWRQDNWSIQLSALLKGKALEVYSRLPVDDCGTYEKLKEALLKRFELTEEGFRKRFRSCRPEQGETFVQYLARARNYIERWFQLGKVEQTYKGVVDYLLRDQLLSICQRELYLFLREKVLVDSNQMAESADLYAEARGGCQVVVSKESSVGQQRGGNTRTHANVVKCFNCGGNHFARDCYKRGREEPSNKAKVAVANQIPDKSGEEFGYTDIRESNRFFKVDRGRGRGRNRYGRDRGGGRGYRQGMNKSSCVVVSHGLERLGVCMVGECPKRRGKVNGNEVDVMRDTGATCVVVRTSLVKPEQYMGKKRCCKYIDGTEHYFPVAMINVETPYFTGTTEALCIESPLYDLVIGNIEGARYPQPNDTVQAVETRSETSQRDKPYRRLKVPDKILNMSKEEFLVLQEGDKTLETIRKKARSGEERLCKGGGKVGFVFRNGLCYRQYTYTDERKVCQLVVPKTGREGVLQIAHDSLMAGHLGVKKTIDRVTSEFYWPSVLADTTRFCRSCDICQRTIPKGRVQKVPLGEMPRIETPFKRVAVDIVGPIAPVTDRKNRYILVMVDYATRYPEAVALPSIEAERVAEALVDMFSRLGIPEEMLTDMGSQFTSGVMKEVSRLLSLRQLTTTPYHPICNGLVEKFNGTLKQMLKRMCAERPKDWDKYLNPMLFAFREVPQESLRFSPFQLLYGRKIRGPMSILKELWSGEVNDTEVKSTYQYVLDLQERLVETCKMAQDHLGKAKLRQKKYYNKKARRREFHAGDKVLILLPVNNNKLLLQWKGPFLIEGNLGNDMDYRIQMGNKVKTFHANMLKRYVEREMDNVEVDRGILTICSAGTVEERNDDVTDSYNEDGDVALDYPSGSTKESVEEVSVSKDINNEQARQVNEILEEFSDILTELPGITSYIQHDIKLTTTEPVRVKGYPIPFHSQETIDEEVSNMIDLGVIEPSEAPYTNPIVLVRKKDDTIRFCIDFRQLNKVTVFDSEPMPNIEEMFSKLSKYKYFSKIDLAKGYWQVPLTERAKDMTSFETSRGLYRFKVMPFGLVCAPATFCRLMRKVLKGLECADSFVDDILVFSETWDQHMVALQQTFGRLRDAGLTAKPSKCYIGFRDIECLGHMIGETLKPIQAKIEAVQRAERPRTKKQVRSFLGVVGFYRKFIPNFAAVAVPLTDLTKKGQLNRVIWTETQERSFKMLKRSLMGPPILKLPELDNMFILRTDSSDVGLGAVLLQEEDEVKLPVAYASRKLLDRERNYAVIEKECLAVVWGVAKFHRYLFGKEFILETDHQPLTYLSKTKMANSRLMRWALALQPYRMRIRAIPGRDNIGADYLSRTDSRE